MKQVIRGLKSVTITPLDADGRPNGEPKTIDLKSTVRLHPRANPIDVYLSTLEIQ